MHLMTGQYPPRWVVYIPFSLQSSTSGLLKGNWGVLELKSKMKKRELSAAVRLILQQNWRDIHRSSKAHGFVLANGKKNGNEVSENKSQSKLHFEYTTTA